MFNFSVQYSFLKIPSGYIATVGVTRSYFRYSFSTSISILCSLWLQKLGNASHEKLSRLGVKDIEVKQVVIVGIITDVSLLFCKNEIRAGGLGWLGIENQVVFVIRDLTLDIMNTARDSDNS